LSPIPSDINIETIYGVGWHDYWQNHLYELNKNFGTEKYIIDFITEAHKRDTWIMLDVVANHVGLNLSTNYFPFNKSEYFHQPLCIVKDYNNQTEARHKSFYVIFFLCLCFSCKFFFEIDSERRNICFFFGRRLTLFVDCMQIAMTLLLICSVLED
jgi:hypothetical protein